MATHKRADTFRTELLKRAADIATVTDQQARAIGLEIFKRVILKTPRDTGYAAGNWQTTVGQAAGGEVSRTGQEIAINEAASVYGSDKLSSRTIFLTNHVPYISLLEYGGYPNPPKGGAGKTAGGFSTQAPQGMVGVTLAEFEQIGRIAVDKVKAP